VQQCISPISSLPARSGGWGQGGLHASIDLKETNLMVGSASPEDEQRGASSSLEVGRAAEEFAGKLAAGELGALGVKRT
jgi:hypothetical protein